jgi:hypothetical protein
MFYLVCFECEVAGMAFGLLLMHLILDGWILEVKGRRPSSGGRSCLT